MGVDRTRARGLPFLSVVTSDRGSGSRNSVVPTGEDSRTDVTIRSLRVFLECPEQAREILGRE